MSLNSVIVIGRQRDIQTLVQKFAENVYAADDISEAIELIHRFNPDLILFSNNFTPAEIDRFQKTTQCIANVPVVIAGTGKEGEQNSYESIKKNNIYYLNSPNDHASLLSIIERIKRKLPLGTSNTDDFFADDIAASVGLAGKSAAVLHTLKMIKVVGSSACNPILITGEMGTGKELAAYAIHLQRSPGREMIAVNCASLNANLLESELFGHEKGAFTSAEREKTGLLELAGSGSIFLDEISEMPLDLQAKLLRVIQEKKFRRVGGTREIACRATIIASSNRDLRQEAGNGRFRADLYHRLCIFPIHLSPLRSPARRSDIRLLAEYFIRTQTICPEKTKWNLSITQLALEALEAYDWPGNVRELRNVIERAVLLETTDKIGLNSIIINPHEPKDFFNADSSEKIKDYSLAKAEQELIARVLRQTNGRKTKAAELLGISRATLYAKLKQHNIDAEPDEQNNEDINPSDMMTESAAIA